MHTQPHELFMFSWWHVGGVYWCARLCNCSLLPPPPLPFPLLLLPIARPPHPLVSQNISGAAPPPQCLGCRWFWKLLLPGEAVKPPESDSSVPPPDTSHQSNLTSLREGGWGGGGVKLHLQRKRRRATLFFGPVLFIERCVFCWWLIRADWWNFTWWLPEFVTCCVKNLYYLQFLLVQSSLQSTRSQSWVFQRDNACAQVQELSLIIFC